MTVMPVDRPTVPGRPSVLMLDEIDLATGEMDALSSIANVIVSSFASKKHATANDQHCTSSNREEFLCDLDNKYANIFGIYRHFKASKSVTVSLGSQLTFVHFSSGTGHWQV